MSISVSTKNEKCASLRCVVSAVHSAYPRHIGIVLKLNYYRMYSQVQNLSHVGTKLIRKLENGAITACCRPVA